jgi:outer membrane lipoprotein SlyB
MRNQWLTLVAAALMALLPLTGGAKGCLKGAAVGGVAGHVAGHHAIAGAAVGCVIGHSRAKAKDREAARASQPAQPASTPPGGAAQK